MILEVRYKGQKINPNDIEIDFTAFWGEKLTGSIEEYGADQWNSAWVECMTDQLPLPKGRGLLNEQ